MQPFPIRHGHLFARHSEILAQLQVVSRAMTICALIPSLYLIFVIGIYLLHAKISENIYFVMLNYLLESRLYMQKLLHLEGRASQAFSISL